jgi:hypothetical protein
LTEHQIVERAQRAAYLDGEIEQKRGEMETALNRAKADAKLAESKIDELEAERRRLSLEVREGSSYMDVDCQMQFIYRTGKVVEMRMDTREVLDERPMNAHERQRELGLQDPKAAGANGAGAADLADPDDDDDADPQDDGGGSDDHDDDDDDSEDEDEDESDDDTIVEDDYPTDTNENPDTSVLGTKVGETFTPPASDFNPDEPQPATPPKLKTQKKAKAGTGGKGGAGKGGGGKAGKGGKGKR